MNVSPSDAVDVPDEAGATGGAEAGGEGAAGVGGGGGRNRSVTDALLHTRPRMAPAEVRRELEVDAGPAHGYIGLRKFISGLGVGGDEEDAGTPAVVNFAAAGWHFIGFGLEGEEEDVDDDQDEAAAAVGGVDEEEEYDDPADPSVEA